MLLDKPLRDTIAVMQSRVMTRTKYRGIEVKKCPLDMWVYVELLFELRPDFVVEIGNWCGGTLCYLSDVCRSMGLGTTFIGVDIDQASVSDIVRNSDRIILMQGDAVELFESVRDCIGSDKSVMVIEDSNHEYSHTLRVLDLYSQIVSVGSYMIVEDTICRHGLDVGPDPGPMEAVSEFKRTNSQFVSDDSYSFGISWNETGYLKRVT